MNGTELIYYLEFRSNVSKLDNFLLYIAGLITFIFTIFQATADKLETFLIWTPLFIICFVFPVYVSYVRGNIKDMLVERIRGWFYLIEGAGIYLGNLIVVLARPIFKSESATELINIILNPLNFVYIVCALILLIVFIMFFFL